MPASRALLHAVLRATYVAAMLALGLYASIHSAYPAERMRSTLCLLASTLANGLVLH